MKQIVKDRMRNLIQREGLTQIEAARIANVKRDYIHKAVQRGSVPNNADVRDRISEALNSSSTWLWFGGDNESSEQKKPKIRIQYLDVGQSAKIFDVESDNVVRQAIVIFDNSSQSGHTHSK
tara:strand:- start:107 stop:472 length:366 start_codon:yes stop_codon:yes gene_type:complete